MTRKPYPRPLLIDTPHNLLLIQDDYQHSMDPEVLAIQVKWSGRALAHLTRRLLMAAPPR